MKTWGSVLALLAIGGLALSLTAGCEPTKTTKPATQPPKITKASATAPAKPAPVKKTSKQPPAGAVSELVLPGPETTAFVTEKNFVMNWLVLGPFQFKETDFKGEHQQESADHEFMPKEGALDGTQEAPKGTSWKVQTFRGDSQAGQVNLDAMFGAIEYAAAYAVAWLDCPQDIPDAKLYVGSDDYIKVWVNGKLVHTYKTARRASSPDQDVIPGIALKKGLNRIVVKCVDVVYDWDFYLRLTDAKGMPFTVKPKAQ